MGVRGLYTIVRAQLIPGVEKTPVPSGSQILIDGSGWVFYLLESPALGEPVRRDLGGDYSELARRAEAEISMFQKHGMKPTVYWDGPRRRMKAQTDASRAVQREDGEDKLRHLCLDGTKYNQEEYPLPVLAFTQVKYILDFMGIEQIRCDEEADRELALASSVAAVDGPPSIVYGNDSDFLLFKDCKYVMFGGFSSADEPFGAQVLTRAKLAHALACTEGALVEWSIFKGNDFTKHFPKCSFQLSVLDQTSGGQSQWGNESDEEEDDLVSITEGCVDQDERMICLLELFERYRLIPAEPSDEELRMAIDFSRKLYSLDSIDAFPFDDEDSHCNTEADGERDLLKELLENTIVDMEAAVSSVIPVAAAKLLLGGAGVDSTLMVNTPLTEGQKLAVFHALPSYKTIDQPNPSLCASRLQWEDITLAKKYQTVCRKLARIVTDYSLMSPSDLGDPRMWFEGDRFHTLAQTYLPPPSPKRAMRKTPLNSASGALPATQGPESTSVTPVVLPIDAHRETICEHIRKHSITIIHGETGCGKSSRIPQMLAEDVGVENVKMYVSQPRRIAATSLRKRVANELGKTLGDKALGDNLVGLRMGHGVKVETEKTRIWFCTAGYLVLLASHHPNVFQTHTHLIIDEIHERSVDTDLLCYIVKGILQKCPRLKVILMSATIAAEIYRDYFDMDTDPLFVGSRRCKLTEHFLEDVMELKDHLALGKAEMQAANELTKCFKSANFQKMAFNQHKLAFHLARRLGTHGRSVLIFVSGMAAIEAIVGMFDDIKTRSQTEYMVIPIHSDVPFEEQMKAFEQDDEVVKVVIATNAASSSITLPDCDNVICLGTEKRIEYDTKRNQVALVGAWISQANAIQRAGRTARIRPGTVWRLYTKEQFHTLDPFDPPEILQTPLNHVILRLRSMLKCPIEPILTSVITAPDPSQIQPAFDSLYNLGFYTQNSDLGELTMHGEIAAALGIDLYLAKLILYGIVLGVTREATCVAAALSSERLPFKRASSFFHNGNQINSIVATTQMAQAEFDDGHYSMPIMMLRLLIWTRKKRRSYHELAQRGLIKTKLKTFTDEVSSLERRVEKFDPEGVKKVLRDPSKESYVANALRLAIFWCYRHQVLGMKSKHIPPTEHLTNRTSVSLKGDPLTQAHIEYILQGEYKGEFQLVIDGRKNIMIQYDASDVENLLQAASDAYAAVVDVGKALVTWIRNGSLGQAEVNAAWLESGDANATAFRHVFEGLFGRGDKHDTFYHFEGTALPKKKGAYKLLRDLCPSFIEISVERPTKTKVFCQVNTKSIDVDLATYFEENNVFPHKLKMSSTVMNAKPLLTFENTLDMAQEGKISPLIRDLPMSLRLLKKIQAYTTGEGRRNGIKVEKILPREKRRTNDKLETQIEEENEELFATMLNVEDASWSFESTGWGEEIMSKKTAFPSIAKESYIQGAVHHSSTEDQTVYAVCASALVTGRARRGVLVDNITLLPPDGQWMAKARLCIDRDEEDEVLESGMDEDLLATANSIYMSVEENTDLVQPGMIRKHIASLFKEFVGGLVPDDEAELNTDLVAGKRCASNRLPKTSSMAAAAVATIVPSHVVMRKKKMATPVPSKQTSLPVMARVEAPSKAMCLPDTTAKSPETPEARTTVPAVAALAVNRTRDAFQDDSNDISAKINQARSRVNQLRTELWRAEEYLRVLEMERNDKEPNAESSDDDEEILL